jgi:phosphatidylserine/phosphatidylglycerophosphate/cardiolipin synthase-like enzyme
MKRILLFLITIFSCQLGQAQIDISIARQASVGQVVTIEGIVTNGSELGTIRYMQDATGGLPVYSTAFAAAINRGDEVQVTGTMDIFGGLLELTNVTWTVLSTSNASPAPLVVTPTGMNITNEGQLVKVNNVTFSNAGGMFTSGTTNFSDGTQIGQIYLRSGHPLVGTIIPQTAVNLTGLSSQYNGSAQMLVRDANDIQVASSFYVTTNVEQTNLTNNGFNLNWQTNANGSSNVEYGLTPALGTHFSGGGSTTNHALTLTGLLPGTIYYARAYSYNGTDTAWASPKVYATVSNSTGTIEVYFNQPVNTGVSTGTNAIHLTGAQMEAKIIDMINNAQVSIDLTSYNQDKTSIVTALNNAVARGVAVRVIGDNETTNSSLQNGTTNFNWFVGNADGLMHNKFIIVDPELVNGAKVWMGSMNFTHEEINDNYNNVVIIQDQALARAYRLEMNEMWGTNTTTIGIFTRKLGADKADNTPHKFMIGGKLVESYFSPSDGTTSAISSALQTADSKIEFALLTFTRNDLRDDLINRHNAGVNIRGMIENVNDTGGEFQTLLNAGINVRDDSAAYLLHHKYAVIDENAVNSDPMVITGSHNWTSSAESNNDENTLIIHDATIANLYAQEFSARWIGYVTKNRNVVSGINGFDITLLGNPAKDALRFEMQNQVTDDIRVMIYNAQGQLLAKEIIQQARGNSNHAMDISAFASGNYIAVFHVDGLAIGKPFVVVH